MTDEQQQVLSEFAKGDSLKINAFAGAGKTSTLVAVGASTQEPGIYLSFNRKNADEAKQKFVDRVNCLTTHALAARSVRHRFSQPQDKLFTNPTTPQIENSLKVEGVIFDQTRFSSRQVAGLVFGSLQKWMYSASGSIDDLRAHPSGKALQLPEHARRQLDEIVLGYGRKCWAKMTDPNDPLPLGHDGYVKYWALEDPKLQTSFVLLDEAQDTNPVILDVLQKQDCQIVYVGDTHQQIYEWRGAVNAMKAIKLRKSLSLTQSFRFGEETSKLANRILRQLDETKPLRGNPNVTTRVGLTNPEAILARTNGMLIAELLSQLEKGRRVSIQGGTDEQLMFLDGINDLQNNRPSSVPELFGIADWEELKEYVKSPEGQSLAVLVRLVESYGVPKLRRALAACVRPEQCDLLLSTLHKAKGLEWNRVKLLADFAPQSESQDKKPSEKEIARFKAAENLRILYVAITRARIELEIPENVREFIYSLSKGRGKDRTSPSEQGVQRGSVDRIKIKREHPKISQPVLPSGESEPEVKPHNQRMEGVQPKLGNSADRDLRVRQPEVPSPQAASGKLEPANQGCLVTVLAIGAGAAATLAMSVLGIVTILLATRNTLH